MRNAGPSGAACEAAMAIAFVFALSGGMLLVLSTGRTTDLVWRFLCLVSAIALALLAGGTLWVLREAAWRINPSNTSAVLLGALAMLGAVGAVFMSRAAARHGGLFRGGCILGGMAGVAVSCLAARALTPDAGATPVMMAAIVVSQVLGSLLLGGVTVAWLLGHAYLTATRMTIAPLMHFSRVLTWTVWARIIFAAAAVVGGAGLFPGGAGLFLERLGADWLVLTIRAGMGLVIVVVFAHMVRECVRVRATQSATGILYFGSIFAYAGELAAQHLMIELGWPI
jgi:hypothetical protein